MPKKSTDALVISGPRRRSTRNGGDTVATPSDEQSPSISEPTDRISTLRSVRNANPGVADAPRPRRSPEEVAKEKQEKEKSVKEAESRRQASIEKAAAIEDALMKKEAQLKTQDISQEPTMQKKKRTRVVEDATAEDIGPIESDGRLSKKKKDSSPSGQSDNDIDELNFGGDISSGAGTEDEYVDNENEIESEDTDDDGGLDDDEDISSGKKSKGSRKQNRGKLREKVNSYRCTSVIETLHVGNKRKTTGSKAIKSAKKKKPNIHGINDNWKEQSYDEVFSDDPVLEGIQESFPPSSNTSGVSSNVEDEEDADEEVKGAVSSDDEGEKAERRALSAVPPQPKLAASFTRTLAKIEPTTSVPTYIHPNQLEVKLKKKQDIRSKKDLPPALRLSFDEVFSPRLRELIGISQPWERLSEKQIGVIWNDVFPNEPLEGWLKTVVMKLVDDNISNWRAKLAKTAVDYFEKSIIPVLEDSSTAGISDWCHWALSGDYKCRPFYYLSYVEGEERVDAKGIFQHSLISATLAYHYSSISAIHPNARRKDHPVGALVLAIQASHRAISRWLTGEFVDIKRPLQDFSKDNWGDNPTRDPKHHPTLQPGVIQESKATSSLLRVVNKLSDKQWTKIVESALGAMRRRKVVTVPAPHHPEPQVEEILSDFSILDNDDSDDVQVE